MLAPVSHKDRNELAKADGMMTDIFAKSAFGLTDAWMSGKKA
jgi:hypothetical protein